MARIIIFGDVHGCVDEWKDLLAKLKASPEDHLYSVGDLICKGPHTAKTLDLAMSLPNLSCVVGNHEQRFLKEIRAGRIPDVKSYDRAAYRDMGDKVDVYVKFMKQRMSMSVEVNDCVRIVHAGIRPGVMMKDQVIEDLTEIRYLADCKTPWHERYNQEPVIVYGHWVRREPLLTKNTIGIDTGCVYGGKLTACIFPDKKNMTVKDAELVSVPARKAYRERKKAWG